MSYMEQKMQEYLEDGMEREEELIKKMNNLMYALTKDASKNSFEEFLYELDISDEDYEAIKAELAKIGITKTYV